MRRRVVIFFSLVALVVGFFLYPLVSNPYFFVCPGGECRYNMTRINQFYKIKFGLRRSPEEIAAARERRRENAHYYRLQAKYSHKDRNTGEIEKIDYDIVVVCGLAVAQAADGSNRSMGFQAPKAFLKATADGGAMFMRVPTACSPAYFKEGGILPKKSRIPDDLMPLVIWFDDVNDIRYGLGYASEDAYKSPISQLKFHGASITRSNFTDWQAWRKTQLASFKPTGAIVSPWGSSLAKETPESYQKRGKYERQPPTQAAGSCGGYARIKLPASAQSDALEFWPKDRPKFWHHFNSSVVWENILKLMVNPNYEGGRRHRDFKFASPSNGVINRRGGGAIRSYYRPADKYIAAPEIYPMRIGEIDSAGVYTRRVDTRPEMQGFVTCGASPKNPVVTFSRTKRWDLDQAFYIGNDLVSKKISGRPYHSIIIEHNKYIWKVIVGNFG